MSEILDASALGPVGAEMGWGGQARVFELAARPGSLVKRYHPDAAVNADGLLALTEWPASLVGKDRRVIDAATAWPTAVVQFSDGLGVVIPRAPAQFMHVVEAQRRPRDLAFAYCEASRFAGVPPATAGMAITIVHRVALVFDVLHRNGVVYGDLSATNVLWSGGVRPWVFLIDCDASWATAFPRALPPAQTGMWEDPWPSDGSAPAEQRRDLYKLALLFMRLYYRSQLPLTSAVSCLALPTEPRLSREVRDLLLQGLRRDGERPSAAEWLDPLRRLERALRQRGAA